ncbi:hypothetical protein NW762_006996 [Fusarium torreyae]|uniref:Uncharacterized protein n=1 Tax=Fusarium torreyae TaxID=1237075 RepID=A0A9W8S068_9HYPO|nr:hypothetical protein NW762_006996 [Fusarium torreyae]
MPRELFKSMSQPKKENPSQAQNTENPAASESETSLLTPQGTESDQRSMSVASAADTETLNSAAPTTSHSNASQPTLSDTASSVSAPWSPGQSSTQGSVNDKSWRDQIKQATNKQGRSGSPVNYVNAAVGTGRGVGRVVTTGARTPMNFCLGLARGFRNMPRLYNDDTIRPVEKVTGVGSGFMVAGKEFGYGLFDGVTGLVTQPLKGAEKEGVQGLIKGFGKGIGGIVAKPAAGFWAIPAYTMQGVHAEISRYFAKSVQNYVISSRAVQGQHEMREATPGERDDIVQRWNNFKCDLKNFYQWKKKEKVAGKRPEEPRPDSADVGFEPPRTGWRHTRNLSFGERKKLHADKEAWKKGYVDVPLPQSSSSDTSSIQTGSSEDAELERAIRASVQETSRGNTEEDAQVEAAMRESIKAVRQRVESDEAGPLPLKDPSIFEDADYQITDEEYQALVEQAIQRSLGNDVPLPQDSGFAELDAKDTTASVSHPPAESTNNENDEEFKRAIEASKNPPPLPPRDDNDDELERAIAASKEAMEKESSQRTEEDIVMEYVKKQSLAEEEYRKEIAKGKGPAGGGEEDDEELRRAMEESLKMSKGDASGPSGS